MFVCCGGNSIDDDDDDCFLVGAAFVSLFTATKHEKKMMKNVYEKKKHDEGKRGGTRERQAFTCHALQKRT